ncbi:MAG: DUF2169 domain-containing protein [Burkholderiaceae bacterium]
MFNVELVNRTPFAALTHVQMDRDGQDLLLAVLCATFSAASDDAPLTLAAEQAPVRYLDEPHGDPARSSIAFESDIATHKPRVDVLVKGHAMARGASSVQELEVALRVADIHKRLRVTGDRRAEGAPPLPFTRMPIVYERAFGGTSPTGDCHLLNPVGIGFRGARSADGAVQSAVANIDYLDPREARHGAHTWPGGLGAVARQWLPRLPLAGTYDQRWLDTVWPLAPADFNPLFNQAAPADQQTDRIDGGETVEILNMTPSGRWCFRLPVLDVPVHWIRADEIQTTRWRIDTVDIDTDRRQVTMKARQAIRMTRQAAPLQSLVMGHVSPAWLKARQQRKPWRPLSGVAPEPPACFHP